ncbi:hypothetical protein HG530_004316 [Fusarium avenaceum]|nr:hypothetical protein HG530_004316 [Fusarium avenaceum]
MGFKHRAFAIKSFNIASAPIFEILSDIVAKSASIAKPALSGRKLRIECSAVTETKGIVELAKVTFCVLALILLLFLFAFVRPALTIFPVSVGSATRFSCVVVVYSIGVMLLR